jgi:hypothetical protein
VNAALVNRRSPFVALSATAKRSKIHTIKILSSTFYTKLDELTLLGVKRITSVLKETYLGKLIVSREN